jgi:adenylate kinase family enzyme
VESNRLKIYFATSLRGGNNFAEVKKQIDFLETIGEVLTKHMADPKTMDMGHKDNTTIHDHDEPLVEECDLFIAEISLPSTGAGYWIRAATDFGKPALLLYKEGLNPSAISGSRKLVTKSYNGDKDFQRCVREFILARHWEFRDYNFKPLQIFLAGLPGSGKGTLAKSLSSEFGLAHVRTGDLVRDIVAKGENSRATTIKRHMEAGELVPAHIMQHVVLDRLEMPDCRMFGFVLDGYPPSKEDLENLQRNNINPSIVFYLECSDATSEARQVGRSERSTDTPEKAKKRVEVFHEAGADYKTLSDEWFPDSMVVQVDAERGVEAVRTLAFDTINNLFLGATPRRSFYPVPPYKAVNVRTDRVHFHIDAMDVDAVKSIAKQIYREHKPAQGQMKIYPIDHLYLGPQTKTMEIYQQIPNFHTIRDSKSEAFITGKLGDGDMELMKAVLRATIAQGGMAEIEEYLGEWTIHADGSVREDSIYGTLDIDMKALREFDQYLCKDIPPLELHFGFNLPKSEGMITLERLMEHCVNAGLNNGGWFVFANEDHYAYRSNEFSFESLSNAVAKLALQATRLRKILNSKLVYVDLSFGLEIVHGIWTVNK